MFLRFFFRDGAFFREANRLSELLASSELQSESEERSEVSLGITRFLFIDFPFFFTK